MLDVELEPKEWHNWPAEQCYFCKDKTRYWYTPLNMPCCQACASVRNVKEFKKESK